MFMNYFYCRTQVGVTVYGFVVIELYIMSHIFWWI